jgi:pentatricopeptide repeat protein
MCEEGAQPNDITFVCLLSACSHAGLVDEGMCCHASMITEYVISGILEHYIYGQPSWLSWPSYRRQRI